MTLINYDTNFLYKLTSYWLPSLRYWIVNYLSTFHIINAVIPKGTVLVPTLFHLYISDLLFSTSTFIQSYADDHTVHASLQYKNQPLSLSYTIMCRSMSKSLS